MNYNRDPLGHLVEETRLAQLCVNGFVALLCVALSATALWCFANPPVSGGHWGAALLPARILFLLVALAGAGGTIYSVARLSRMP
ncbi:MAG: hypothetical protein KBA91_02800 [Candidatus Moranbacteria bacterium]|jgi:hypothetical protein|nr:hypothetical protein [Candidatus Moranbacteria bacterium]